MHAAQVTAFGAPPTYTTVPTPPTPTDAHVLIKVHAAGLHNVVRSRASGTHYSASASQLPLIPGIDGVGTTSTGEKVYFSSMARGGTYAEYVSVSKSAVVPIPQGVDEMQVAAYLNPALSSWMALRTRVVGLEGLKGFSVLIMGVTSASGGIAVDVARSLGAGRVVGVARNVSKMSSMGLDGMIELKREVETTDFSSVGDVDVVLDYLYGAPAEHLLRSLGSKRRVQYVHIGGLAGTEMNLPGAVLRSRDLSISGSGPGAWSMAQAQAELPALLETFKQFRPREFKALPLREVESGWGIRDERVVFVP